MSESGDNDTGGRRAPAAPRRRIFESDRQAVLDAAAVLQLRRSEIANALAGGRTHEAEIVVAYPRDRGQTTLGDQQPWRDLLSVRPSVTVGELRSSLPRTRGLIQRGLQMVSVYDADGISPGARTLLAGETLGTYLVSVAPVQMKIVNRSQVLLQGPAQGETATVMTVRSRPCVDAAWRYWEAVRAAAFPVADSVALIADLTMRQRQVISLMANGVGDDAIASALGVSVRTVRADIAGILDHLGVQSRFAAGVRLELALSLQEPATGETPA